MMTNPPRSVLFILVLGLLGCFASPSHAEPYKITDLGALPNHTTRSVALWTNDKGEVAGFSEDAVGYRRAFLWLPEPAYGLPAGMNDRGPFKPPQFSAASVNMQNRWTGFKDEPGTEGFPSNDRAFTWDATDGFQLLGVLPGGRESGGKDINDASSVVGWSQIAGTAPNGERLIRGFVWDAALGMQALVPLPGFAHTWAGGVNDSGAIVGTAADSGSEVVSVAWFYNFAGSRALEWRGGIPIDLNSLIDPGEGWILETAVDVNNLGQVVGTGLNPAGERRAFLLAPAASDFNTDGVTSAPDTFDFYDAYFQGDPTADYNRDGFVGGDDPIVFMGAGDGTGPNPGDDCEVVRLLILLGDPWADFPQWVCDGLETYEDWLACPPCWNCYHPKWNPSCHGCPGNSEGNPGPDGKPGWPGDAEGNPYFPDGGPGGDGAPNGDGGEGGKGAPGGSGGNGGDGGDDGGIGGAGGDAGSDGDGHGGNGGPGGGADLDTPAGNGGTGGAGSGAGSGGLGGEGGGGSDNRPGGTGGVGGAGGGEGGQGGKGGNGGSGDGFGSGGSGGNGGGGGRGENTGEPNGGNGGAGGGGGQGGQGGSDGNGGAGGNGGNAGNGGPSGGNGGQGGDAGNGGGSGSRLDAPLRGGNGGNAGNGGNGGPRGNGGNGGGGGDGGPPGGGERGGDGGRGGAGGNGDGDGQRGGNGGNGGDGGGGAAPLPPGGFGGPPGGCSGCTPGSPGAPGSPPPP